MSSELDKICRMLEEGPAELQCAAAVVLGNLGAKGPAVRKALLHATKSSDDNVRLHALGALAVVDPAEAIPQLMPFLSGPEPARGRAIGFIAARGGAAADALKGELAKADPEARRGLLETLGRLQDVDTTDALLAGLTDSDPDVVQQAAQALRRRIGALQSGARGTLLRRLLALAGSPRARKNPAGLAACLGVAGALGDPSVTKLFLGYLDRKQPAIVRGGALQALAGLPLPEKAGRGIALKVLPLLRSDDYNSVVRPALELLEKLPVGRELEKPLLDLMGNPHLQARLYAVKALGKIGTAAAAVALTKALFVPDRAVVEAAGASLGGSAVHVPALLKALDGEEDPARAWKIANVLRAHPGLLDREILRGLVPRCIVTDRKRRERAQVYFEILRAASPEILRDAVLKKGREHLSRKAFEEAQGLLQLLDRDDLATGESEYTLAVARLGSQRQDLSMAGRDRGPAIFLFSKLARREGFPLVQHLQKDAGLLSAGGLLYLGFALIERQGPERDAGAEVLKCVVKKFGSKEEGRVARHKLRTQGMA